MKSESLIGPFPTCSAVPCVMALVILGPKQTGKSTLLSFPSPSPSSVSWSATEQDGYDPFSSAWDDPENGDVELKSLCLTAISSAGSGEREHHKQLISQVISLRLHNI